MPARTPAANTRKRTAAPSKRKPAAKRTGRRTLLLDPNVRDRILDAVRAGAFDHVAASAAGVGVTTFYRWCQTGRDHAEAGQTSPEREFWEQVEEARGAARLSAELRVARDDPYKWLRFGPGRERPGRPGWADQTVVTGAEGGPVVIELTFAEHDEEEPDG